MIDTSLIAGRIKYQRKKVLHISQERMAEELNMYQSDISKMENGEKYSALNDLQKLDMIAEYLGVSLAYLIFGKELEN